MRIFWPLFILIPGLCLEVEYFSKKTNPGVLVPGGILTTIGLLFMFEIITRWRYMGKTWPVFILAVAIGLFQFYYFGNRERSVLISSMILLAISLFSFASITIGRVLIFFRRYLGIPALLVIAGVIILFSGNKKE